MCVWEGKIKNNSNPVTMEDWNWHGGQDWEPHQSPEDGQLHDQCRRGESWERERNLERESTWKAGPRIARGWSGQQEKIGDTREWTEWDQPDTMGVPMTWSQNVIQGRVIEPQQPVNASPDEKPGVQNMENVRDNNQRQEQTRIRQWEGLLAISMQQHQLK